MDNYILQKDVEVKGDKYRFAIFEEIEGGNVYFYTAFAEISEGEHFELIYGERFESEQEAWQGIQYLMQYLVDFGN